MNNRYLYRGKRIDNGKWVIGYYCYMGQYSEQKHYIIPKYASDFYGLEVDSATVSQCTGLLAAKSYRGESEEGRLVFEGDITELVLPDGEVRRFEVATKTVIREVVSHPDFDKSTTKVAITGVVFLWSGYELFPCVDQDDNVDTNKMSIIGNIWNNPELLEVGND